MKVTEGRYYKGNHGYPMMELIIDGYSCSFGDGIKRTIIESVGAVPLDGYPKDTLPVIPAPALDMELKGFTDDPKVVRLVTEFMDATDNGTFTVGEIAVNV